VLPEENEQQILGFLGAHRDARETPLVARWGRPCRAGRQILPGDEGMDGFYYACLEKQ
jgi:16S rRNA (cytosine967-C5)-methyltransferase